MRAIVYMAAAILLASCTTRATMPSDVDMDQIEAALAEDPCVGPLKDWQRQYYFHPKYFGDEVAAAAREGRTPRSSGHVRSMIGFELRADAAKKLSGRMALDRPPEGQWGAATDGERRAAGHFDLSAKLLTMAHCDPKKLAPDAKALPAAP